MYLRTTEIKQTYTLISVNEETNEETILPIRVCNIIEAESFIQKLIGSGEHTMIVVRVSRDVVFYK